MDYKGIKCPVCESAFRERDDIVVCPKCGAPYHRSCYEQKGSCIFIDLHAQNKSWEAPKEPEPVNEAENEAVICRRCGAKNAPGALFCNKCAYPLSNGPQSAPFTPNNNAPQNNYQTVSPNNTGPSVLFIDVMGGYRKEEPVADNVSAGDLFEIVKTNQPYYMTVFHNKQYFGKGKFNFSAFLFSGGWLLYRKINKIGIILTAVIAALMIAETYLSFAVITPMMAETFAAMGVDIARGVSYSDIFALTEHLMNNDPASMLLMCIPSLLNFVRIIIMVICGIKGNAWYFEECKKKVNRIKAECDVNSPEYHERLFSEGGVNTAVAICLLVCSMIIDYIPGLFL